MKSGMQPLAIQSKTYASLLDHILRYCSNTTLVICLTRGDFTQRTLSECERDDATWEALLKPTIYLLSVSSRVRTVFVSDVIHLRAYLGSRTADANPQGTGSAANGPLVVLGLIDLLRSSGDLCAQSILRLCALAVDAAYACDVQLILADRVQQDSHDIGDRGQETLHQGDLWSEEVPMLSGDARLGDTARKWIGRTVQIRRILGRWCTFQFLDGERPENDPT